MKFVCIDGNSIVNRAFYGIKLLTTKDGSYTNAIYGFLNILLGIRQEVEPDGIAIAFDLRAPTFRHLQYDQYLSLIHIWRRRRGWPPAWRSPGFAQTGAGRHRR